MQARICLKVVLQFLGLEILIGLTSVNKSYIGWPQQPPTGREQISVKVNFDDPFHKKDHLVVIRRINVFMKWGAVKVIEATEVVVAVEAIEAAELIRPGQSLLRTSESSRSLNSALFWCFDSLLKKYWYGRFMRYHIVIYNIFCRRLLRPAYVTFLRTGW